MNKNSNSISLNFFGIAIFLMTLVSCWGSDSDDPNPYEDANRTVIGLILADNSLDTFSNSDIKEMIAGMDESSVDWDKNNVLLFVDNKSTAPLILRLRREDGKNSAIIRDTVFVYTAEIVANIPDIDSYESSSTESMCKDALKRIITDYSAKSYGLILWSHGDGWIPSDNYVAPAVATRKFGQDTDTGTYPSVKWLENSELKSIIATSCSFMTTTDKKYDFIYADACQMANNTTVYDFRDYCNYFIGSVAEIPGPGGYYTTQLPAMFETSGIPAIAVAEAYDEYYNRDYHWVSNAGVQISVIKMSELDNLAAVTKSFLEIPEIAASIASLDWSPINHFDWGRSNGTTIYYDFKQTMEAVLTSDQLAVWQKAFDAAVVLNIVPETIYSSILPGEFEANPCCGLAAYFPNDATYKKWNTYFQNYEWYLAAGMNDVQDEIP